MSNNISFIMPVYNSENTIEEAVYSIISGNFEKGDEIIIVDDCSIDNTSTIIKKLASQFSSIKILKNKYRKRCGASRNYAIENSKNDLIFNLDSDNVLVPNSIKSLKRFLLKNKLEAVSFGKVSYFKNSINEITHSWEYKDITDFCDYLSISKVSGCSGNYLFTKNSWEKAGGYPEFVPILDCWGFGLRQVATGTKIAAFPNSYYFHRCSSNSNFIVENQKGRTSLVALQLLIPFFDWIDENDINYIMKQKNRYNWFEKIDEHPIRVLEKQKISFNKIKKNRSIFDIVVKLKNRCFNLLIKINKMIIKNLNILKFMHNKKNRIQFKQLRIDINLLPGIDISKAKSNAEKEWLNNRNELRKNLLENNIVNFLNWKIIRRTMFINKADFIFNELNELKKSRDWKFIWKKSIHENYIGLPERFKYYKKSSANLIHQAYHLKMLTDHVKIDLKEVDYILEFGGGYGCLCRLFHKLGYKGKYIIFDFPEFSALQKFYLKTNKYKIIEDNNFNKNVNGIYCISDLKILDSINFDQGVNNLFIANWSISETSIDLREKFLKLPIMKNFNLYLIAYQNMFNKINNIEYFKNFKKNYKHIKWIDKEITHLRGNSYLFGERY